MVCVKSMVALLLVGLLIASSSSPSSGMEDIQRIAVAGHPPPPPFIIRPPFGPPFRPPPLRFPVAVEGVIYCESCKLAGYDKFLDASPLPGAVAKLQCSSSRHGITVSATTDSKGYFLIYTPKVTTFAVHKCKVVVSSPLPWCNKPVNLGKPAHLKFERVIKLGQNQCALFAAGFFEFAPANQTLCPRVP